MGISNLIIINRQENVVLLARLVPLVLRVFLDQLAPLALVVPLALMVQRALFSITQQMGIMILQTKN